MHFKLGYRTVFKKKGRGNTVVSDLAGTRLKEVVDVIDSVDGLSVNYTEEKPILSRSQGTVEKTSFVVDAPQDYTVCGTVHSLTKEMHNRLCLLRGVLYEYLPKGGYFGSCLPEVVRVSLCSVLCSFPLWYIHLFCRGRCSQPCHAVFRRDMRQ